MIGVSRLCAAGHILSWLRSPLSCDVLLAIISLFAIAGAVCDKANQGPKVELHTHIDGSLSPKTLWTIAHIRNMQGMFPKDVKESEDLQKYISIKEGGSLEQFLSTFDFFFPFISNDVMAVETLGKAFVLQQAANNVLYTEGRFGPQLLTGSNTTVDSIIMAMLKGIDEGLKDVQVKLPSMRVNVILCCMRGHHPDQCHDIVDLAAKYKSYESGVKTWKPARVVGIDMAEGGGKATAPFSAWLPAFRYAYAQGVHATVHAGEECVAPEDCPANCETAMEMQVTRIGHGYNCGERAWDQLQRASIHFEGCPTSSIGTGAVKSWDDHPIKIYADRNYSFSINTDDGGVLATNETNEVCVAQTKIGLTRAERARAAMNAAMAAFLPPEDISAILRHLAAHQNVVELYL